MISHTGISAYTLLDDKAVGKRKFRGERPGSRQQRKNKRTENGGPVRLTSKITHFVILTFKM